MFLSHVFDPQPGHSPCFCTSQSRPAHISSFAFGDPLERATPCFVSPSWSGDAFMPRPLSSAPAQMPPLLWYALLVRQAFVAPATAFCVAFLERRVFTSSVWLWYALLVRQAFVAPPQLDLCRLGTLLFLRRRQAKWQDSQKSWRKDICL